MYTIPNHYNYPSFKEDMDSLNSFKETERISCEYSARMHAELSLPDFFLESLRDNAESRKKITLNQIRHIHWKFNFHREKVLEELCFRERERRIKNEKKGILLYYKERSVIVSEKIVQNNYNKSITLKEIFEKILRYLNDCFEQTRTFIFRGKH